MSMQEAYVRGVSSWNFDVGALKSSALADGSQELPPIPEIPGAVLCATGLWLQENVLFLFSCSRYSCDRHIGPTVFLILFMPLHLSQFAGCLTGFSCPGADVNGGSSRNLHVDGSSHPVSGTTSPISYPGTPIPTQQPSDLMRSGSANVGPPVLDRITGSFERATPSLTPGKERPKMPAGVPVASAAGAAKPAHKVRFSCQRLALRVKLHYYQPSISTLPLVLTYADMIQS